MILRISKWRMRGGGSVVARGLIDINAFDAKILYLETQRDLLDKPPLRAEEHSAMRMDFGNTLTLVDRMLLKHDLLLIHSHGRIAGLHSRLCRLRYGRRVKVIHSFHGVTSFKPLKRWFTLVSESLLSVLTDALICDSESERKAFGFLPVFCEMSTISPFYDQGNLVEHEIGAVRRIGFASRFDFPKLHEDLIRLVAASNQRGMRQFKLVFCGDGPTRERVDRLGRSLLGEGYESLGHIDHIGEFYGAIDAYAHFSRYEGMPLGLIEAMACGLPVIATNVPGCRDLIRHGETGLLVNLGDLAGGLAALDLLADNAVAERLGAAAKRYARTGHSKAAFRSRHIELYRHIGYDISANNSGDL